MKMRQRQQFRTENENKVLHFTTMLSGINDVFAFSFIIFDITEGITQYTVPGI